MISEQQWQSLTHLNRGYFKHPDKLDFSIVAALDRFVPIVGMIPVLLSDWRPFDPKNPGSQHAQGRAVDVTFPYENAVAVWTRAHESGLFDGIGVYQNEAGAVSFHFDTRGFPARWGGVITRPVVDGQPQKRIEYTSADVVLDMIKKKGPIYLTGLFLLWWFFGRKGK